MLPVIGLRSAVSAFVQTYVGLLRGIVPDLFAFSTRKLGEGFFCVGLGVLVQGVENRLPSIYITKKYHKVHCQVHGVW